MKPLSFGQRFQLKEMNDLTSFISFNLNNEKIPWVFILSNKSRTVQNAKMSQCLLEFRILVLLANDLYNKRFSEALALKSQDMQIEDTSEVNFELRYNQLTEKLKKSVCSSCAEKAKLDETEFFFGYEDYVKYSNQIRSALKEGCCKNNLSIPPELPETLPKYNEEVQKQFTENIFEEDYFFAMQIWSEDNLKFVVDIYYRNEKKMDPLINFLTEEFF